MQSLDYVWIMCINVLTENEHIIVKSNETEKKESRTNIENSGAKLETFNFGAEIIEICMLALYGPW
jgi:hypothetical protein